MLADARTVKHLLFATMLATALAPASIVAASFRIAPGPLEQALLELSRQSGVQLVFDSSLVAGKQTQGLSTTATDPAKALASLLRDSGLHVELIGSNAFVLKPDARPATPPALPAINSDELHAVDLPGMRSDALLPRTAFETSQPITVIDRQRIESSGFQTLYELLRAQPGIRVDNAPVATGDSQSYINSGLSNATGAASVSLQGIGSGATPVLINGQRMVNYALTQGQFGTSTDLNGIPLAMIDRVEILREGASVLYGADAMAGAVNIVLRRQFEGADLSAGSGISSRGDGATQRVSGTFGKAWPSDAGHATFSFDYLHRQPLLNRQRNWSDRNGFLDSTGTYDVIFDNYGFAYQGSVCRIYRFDDPCQAHPDAQATLQSGLTSQSMLLHLDHRLGDVSLQADLRWVQLQQDQQSPPATRASNDIDPDSDRVRTWSFDQLGPITDATRSRSLQLALSALGMAGDWDWKLLVDGQRNRGVDRIHGLILNSNLGVPPGPKLTADDVAYPAPTVIRRGQANRFGATARASRALGEIAGQTVDLTLGAEAYREQLVDRPDPLVLSGGIVQQQTPGDRSDSRTNLATYAELKLPLARRLSTDLGARIERTGGYGTTASPQAGFKWDVRDWLSLRGSWALGHRTPPMLALRQSNTILDQTALLTFLPSSMLPCHDVYQYFSTEYVACLLKLQSAGNPHLKPERSRGARIGAVLAVNDNLGITIDAYQMVRFHEIAALPTSYIAMNPELFPDAFPRNEQGEIYALQQQLTNVGETRLRTLDTNATWQWRTASHGQLIFNLGANWLMQLKRRFLANDPWTSFDGNANQPKLTALASIEWRSSNWMLGTNLRYTGHSGYMPYRPHDVYTYKDQYCTTNADSGHCGAPAFTLVDANMNYLGWRNLALGFHVHNLFDHQPRFSSVSPLAYSTSFDDILGRYYQLSVRYRY